MLCKNLILGTAIGLCLLAPSAHASVTVSPGGAGSASFNAGTGEWEVTINVSGTGADTAVTVFAADTDTITFVEVMTQSNSNYKIELTVDSPLNVKSVSKVGGSGELWITLVSADAVGNVTANIIGTIRALTYDVYGDITQQDDGTPLAGVGVDGIDLIEAQNTNGNITGDISADRLIDFISAFYGTIGTNASTRSTIQCDTKIDDIVAEEVFADITVGTGGNANLNSLVARLGDFAGSLVCARIVGAGYPDGGLDVFGDLRADIDHDANVMSTHFRIWGSLDSSADILLPTAGLTKQITINNANTGADWDGNVKLNGTAISHDANGVYTNTPVSLGYGSVGQARFRFHPEGSNPADVATVYDSYYDPEWVGEGDPPCGHNFKHAYIRHFGPIHKDPGWSSDIYFIERRPAGSSGSWTDVTSSFNTPSVSSISGGIPRSMDITRVGVVAWDVDYEYRFTLVQLSPGSMLFDTALLNTDVVNEPYVPAYTYSFTLVDACGDFLDNFFDQNGDEMLTESDLGAWPGVNADLNLDNATTSADFVLLVQGVIQRSALP